MRTFDGMNQAFWSESEGQYVLYYRQHAIESTGEAVDTIDYRADSARTVARTTSPDFVHRNGRHMLDWHGHAPTARESIYINGLKPHFRAPHIYVGLAARFMEGRAALTSEQVQPMDDALEAAGWPRSSGSEGSWLRLDCSDSVLLTSRGGEDIERTFLEAIIRPGLGYGNGTSRSNFAALGLLQTGPAEMSCYVQRHYGQAEPYLERLTFRLDGFTSVNAPYAGGELLTKPFTFSGEELVINFSTSAAGFVRVEIQADNPESPAPPGKAIAGFMLEECAEIIGDEIERVVQWNGDADVSALAGKPVRLRFVMKDADLFSFQFR